MTLKDGMVCLTVDQVVGLVERLRNMGAVDVLITDATVKVSFGPPPPARAKRALHGTSADAERERLEAERRNELDGV